MIGVIVIAVAACNAPEHGQSLRQPGSMLQPVADDRAIAAAVKAAFRGDGSLGDDAIAVDSRDGAIELTGAVDEQAQIDRPMALAFVVPGVRSIRNRVRLGLKCTGNAGTPPLSRYGARRSLVERSGRSADPDRQRRQGGALG